MTKVLRYFDLDLDALRRKPKWDLATESRIGKELGGIFFADLFGYAALRAKGHHVGNGVTEGACKALVMLRAKRSGQRWKPEGIRAVLTLRSIPLNERIRPFWNRLQQSTNVLQPLAA